MDKYIPGGAQYPAANQDVNGPARCNKAVRVLPLVRYHAAAELRALKEEDIGLQVLNTKGLLAKNSTMQEIKSKPRHQGPPGKELDNARDQVEA